MIYLKRRTCGDGVAWQEDPTTPNDDYWAAQWPEMAVYICVCVVIYSRIVQLIHMPVLIV